MLVWLAEYLEQFNSGFAVFQYLTFRGILGVLTALGISLLLGPWMIRRLNILQIGQSVRDDGPESHLSKSGTPTMGGILIIACVVIPTLLLSKLDNIYILLMLLTTIWMGGIGFLDDYIKTVKKNKEGLAGKYKVVGQMLSWVICRYVAMMACMHSFVLGHSWIVDISRTSRFALYASL